MTTTSNISSPRTTIATPPSEVEKPKISPLTGEDSFSTSRVSRFADLAITATDNRYDLEAVNALIAKLLQGRTTSLVDSRTFVDQSLVEETFGQKMAARRSLFLELTSGRANQIAELAPRDAQAVLRFLLRSASNAGIEDPSQVVALLEANPDPRSAQAALERALPGGWTVLRRGGQLVATQDNNQSYPQPLQIQYQRHGADSYRISIAGHGRDHQAHALSIIVTEGGSALLVAPRRIALGRTGDALPALNQALLDQSPTLSFDELALRKQRPDLAPVLDQQVSVLGHQMRLGDALERAVQESSLWAAEEYLIPAANAEDSADIRWQILSAMANRYLPGKFPGRSGLVNKFFELRAQELESEMDELAAMAGEPPFRLREAVANSQDLIEDLIGEVLDQASGDPRKIEQLRQDAVARSWQRTAEAMPGEENGGTIGALLGLFSEKD